MAPSPQRWYFSLSKAQIPIEIDIEFTLQSSCHKRQQVEQPLWFGGSRQSFKVQTSTLRGIDKRYGQRSTQSSFENRKLDRLIHGLVDRIKKNDLSSPETSIRPVNFFVWRNHSLFSITIAISCLLVSSQNFVWGSLCW